jgi:hypothetical protein
MVNGHHLTMNLADHDLRFETRSDAGWIAVRVAPLVTQSEVKKRRLDRARSDSD